ncbi:UNVERIFIED_CONTAM: putative mitochondrial protein [Sesamum latifolium]|uniref:Mitochondrial protein n=1 Tax=Sesamum latifolium TaxID=2727402 RepID=A0AAW2STV0_9LAMI
MWTRSTELVKEDPIRAEDCAKRRRLHSELEEFLSREEILWKQWGKAQWLAEGDRNTPYFHARASARRRKNFISRLRDKNGEWCATHDGIQQIISSYFAELCQTSSPSEEAMDGVIREMPARVSENMNDTLIQPFSADEVKLAISQMYPYKSPGPDGMSPIFYQKYWHIVGSEVTSFILDFLNHRHFDTMFNYTYIVLIPKCASPENMSCFHPISLCNITYKIVSKMIANRLKPLLPTIVSESQSAFIPGRLITDNGLVAYELNHYLAQKTWGSVGHAALKLDLSKAYDRVEWTFLVRVLDKLGFHSHFISLIYLCVSSISYSFILDGHKFRFFHPGRGLRQGDPLSPYLFLFCAEALSVSINMVVSQGELPGMAVSRQGPRVSHLLFADDTLVLCQGTQEALQCVGRILREFEAASGLMVNLEKSSVAFSQNIFENLKNDLASMLGVRVVTKHDRYLGLSAMVDRSKREIFQTLKDRVWEKMQSWRCRNLLQAGKVVLLKSMVQAMPTFMMGCFLVPSSICRKIESMMADFLWHNKDLRRVHWLSWDKLCAIKQEGGLGFRKLGAFNRTMLAKQIWRILTNPDSLRSRMLKQKYYPNSEDKWLPRPLSFQVITTLNTLGEDAKVEELLDSEGCWNDELIHSVFLPMDVDIIMGINRAVGSPDSLLWHCEKNGRYSMKSAYRLITNGAHTHLQSGPIGAKSFKSDSWRFIWQASVPPKIHLLTWRAYRDSLPTSSNLQKRGVAKDGVCPWWG